MSAIDMIAIAVIVTAAVLAAPSYGRSPKYLRVAASAGCAADSASRGSVSLAPPGILSFRPYHRRADDVRTSDVVGLTVYNLRNEKVGLIADVIMGRDQIVTGYIINVGGLFGVGDRSIAVTSKSVLLLARNGRLNRVLIDATRESLKEAARFEWPPAKDRPEAVSDALVGASRKQ